jgi:hypothetical protein
VGGLISDATFTSRGMMPAYKYTIKKRKGLDIPAGSYLIIKTQYLDANTNLAEIKATLGGITVDYIANMYSHVWANQLGKILLFPCGGGSTADNFSYQIFSNAPSSVTVKHTYSNYQYTVQIAFTAKAYVEVDFSNQIYCSVSSTAVIS